MIVSDNECIHTNLRSLLTGHESSHEFRSALLHVESCSTCQVRLERMAAESGLWNEAQAALSNIDVLAGNDSDTDELSHLLGRRSVAWDESMIRGLLSPASHPEMLGRIGRYDVERVIGSGGMGVVFKAYDTELNRPVAVKLLAPYLASSGAARQRFAREARAAAAVVDEHVVAIHNVESDGEHPFLVMKYIGGGSLQQRLDRDGPLKVCEVLRIGMHTAKGLAAAHAQGLIHRDVKPSNILLDEGVDRALLTDFGLARASDDASLTRSGFHPGTPHYMSPEQVRGEAIDGRSDLFGLGCVLYALCTGHPPFRSETSYAVLRRITDDTPRSIREINPDVPAWLEQIVMKLLAKSPNNRFDSAAQVAELLEDCLAHLQQPTNVPLTQSVEQLSQLLLAIPVAATSPQEQVGQSFYTRPPFRKFIAAAAGGFAMILLSVLIVLELNKGTLTIHSEADDIPIRIMQGDRVVERFTISMKDKIFRIAAGKYVVVIDGKTDGIVVNDGGIIELKRGDSKTVRIELSDRNDMRVVSYDVSALIDNKDKRPVANQLSALADVLVSTVEPESWRTNEVSVESVPQNLSLLVRQSNSGHAAIQSFFDSLHQLQSQRVTQDVADGLVTVTFSGTINNASVVSSGVGWMVDDAGHIILPSHVTPVCDDESIELCYVSGVRCSAKRLKRLGHLALLKSERLGTGTMISLNSALSLTNGETVSAILNGTDNVAGSITNVRKTIALSEKDGVKMHPPVRFSNVITTDFQADDTTLSGAPLLTKRGEVAGMLIRLGTTELIAIPVAEIRIAWQQFQEHISGVVDPTSPDSFRSR